METEVLAKDVLPYIQVWTLAIIFVLLILTYHLWHFGKKYPEIFQEDTSAEDQKIRLRKAELRRRYNNKSMLSISVIFIWMIGMVGICFGFESSALTAQGWGILALAVYAVLWVLSMLQRKPKK
ncbi:MAG: hypothetical protein J6N49_05460 [Alphaproteobacteria bacterium]|nr:hypothetical protein [Alphaproteobacteria bacterium]